VSAEAEQTSRELAWEDERARYEEKIAALETRGPTSAPSPGDDAGDNAAAADGGGDTVTMTSEEARRAETDREELAFE
jgi:hypothetical protein